MKILIKNQYIFRPSLYILLAALFFLFFISLFYINNNVLRFGDFPQYWAAGRLQILHKNPYDPGLVIQLRNEVGQSVELTNAPTMVLYPPWTLPLLIPLGLLTYQASWSVWLILHIIILLYCARKIWSLYDGPQSHRWIASVILLSFFPNLFVLLIGQISPVFLLGAVLFLSNIDENNGSTARDLVAGISLALLTIKPQLVLLVFLILLFWVFDQKRWKVLFGTAFILLIFTIIAIKINPGVFNQYFYTMSKYPMGYWATPTMGMVLRYFIGIKLLWLQFIPLLFGVIWMIYYWHKYKDGWIWVDHLPIVIFVSILCSPYGWTYDFTILLLPLLHGAVLLTKSDLKKVRNKFVFIFLDLNLIVFLTHLKLTDFWFFWFVPVLLVWYLSAVKITQHDDRETIHKIESFPI